MRAFLRVVGVVALIAWTVLGAAAWLAAKDGVQITLRAGDAGSAPEPVALLDDRLDAMSADLQALAGALETSFGMLEARVAAASPSEAGLAPCLGAPEDPPPLSEPSGSATPATEAAPDGVPSRPAGERIEPAASFLAFRLPSQTFERDALRTWTIASGLSRVGFDAQSSLHDFSGATTAVRGEILVNPARPADGLSGRIVVDVAGLDTGLADRDEAMLEHLAADRFATIEFAPAGFEIERLDADGAMRGVVRGEMTIRGRTRPFSMTVDATLDDARRLVIEGSGPLALPDYDVPVPSKLGLVKMEPEVSVWITLRARPGAEAK